MSAARLALVALVLFASACRSPEVLRGGEGTANPDLDRPALSIQLDRDDITYLVADYLERLEASPFWQGAIRDAGTQPVVAIWPIRNATTQHIDEQMQTLLQSIETALVNTGVVRVVDRSRQDALTREIGIQQGAEFDPASARELGRMLGAQYFFTGDLRSVDEKLQKTRRVQYTLFLKVLEIENGMIRFQNEVTRTKQLRR